MTVPGAAVAASYNIHGNVGRDRQRDPRRIASVINEIGPDVAGLQEVIAASEAEAVCAMRVVQKETGLHAVFGRTEDWGQGHHYGNLLLTRWPVVADRWVDLHVPPFEPRGAIVALLDGPFGPLRVVVTHLGLRARERALQIDRLRLALDDGKADMPTLFLGDFNCWGGRQRMLCPLGAPLTKALRPRSFPSHYPVMALDRIWAVPDRLVSSVTVHRSTLARRASDHLPVVAGLAAWDRLARS